jgi:hypothetical protein
VNLRGANTLDRPKPRESRFVGPWSLLSAWVSPALSLPLLVALALIGLWDLAVRLSGNDLFPTPWQLAIL